MAKRTIEIGSEGAYLHTKDQQLLIDRDGLTVGSVPVEDIGTLILDSPRALVTQTALGRIAEQGGITILCGGNHHPLAMVWPIAANEMTTERLYRQINLSLPAQKRFWQQIVAAKISNQAAVLDQIGTPDTEALARDLRILSREVKSGDSSNAEAQAARLYWQSMFGSEFRRDRDGEAPNPILNYGYAILRATCARAICATGLHPAFGLFHRNKYNAFCLADDLMEPFRPYVDSRAYVLHSNGALFMDRDMKRELLSVLTAPCHYGNVTGPVEQAIVRLVQSLVSAIYQERRNLELPTYTTEPMRDDASDAP